MAYFMHSSRLFRCVDTNNCCKLVLLSTAATVSTSRPQSASGLFISITWLLTCVAKNKDNRMLAIPRKYTWTFGGNFSSRTTGKYSVSKSATARSADCLTASAWGIPSFLSLPYVTSSNASNLVNIATTGTAKNGLQTIISTNTEQCTAHHSLYRTLQRNSALLLWKAFRHPSGCSTYGGQKMDRTKLQIDDNPPYDM